MTEQSLEQQLEKQQRRIQELELENEALNREIDGFLEEVGVSSQQISDYVHNQDNFSKEEWQRLQACSSDLEQKLQQKLENIADPRKNKKNYDERNIPQHWVFVR